MEHTHARPACTHGLETRCGGRALFHSKWIRDLLVHFCSFSGKEKEKYPSCVCAFWIFPWLSFDTMSPDPIRRGLGAGAHVYPRSSWDWTLPLLPAPSSLTDKDKGNILTELAGQGKIVPAVATHEFLGGGKKSLGLFFRCGYIHRLVCKHQFKKKKNWFSLKVTRE